MHTPQLWPRSRTGRLRVSAFLALAVAATLFLVVSAGAGARNNADAKTFIYGTQTDPGNGQCDGSQTVFVALNLNCFQLVQETLVKLNYQTNKLEPGLAVSWTQPTPSSVTLKLRPNVKFSDGTPFNADAVVYNFKPDLRQGRSRLGRRDLHVRELRPLQEHLEGRRHDGEGHLHERAGERHLDALERSRLHAEPDRRRERGQELRQRGLSGPGRTS